MIVIAIKKVAAPGLLVRISKPCFAAAFLLLWPVVMMAQTSADKAWTALQAGIAAKALDDRAAAVRLLGLLQNNPKAAELALKSLNDPKPEVRTAAADALGQMKAASATQTLKDLIMKETDAGVVIACAHALISLGDPLGYNVYYAVLTGERKSGGSLMDSQKKMLNDPKKMAKFGFEQGIGFVPFGGIGYGAFKVATKDDDSPVRAAAAAVLAKDPDPKSGDALVASASDKSWIVRAAALDAISRRNDPSLLPKIEDKLNDDKDIVRYSAAAAILHLTDLKNEAPRGAGQ